MRIYIGLMIVFIIFMAACSEYQASPHKECDYSNKYECENHNCRWHSLDDVQGPPEPHTCCPKDIYSCEVPYDHNDPCTICPG